jgi:nucleoside transporter
MRNTSARLSLMMFLEFFVWGSWYVTVGNYMTSIGMADAVYWAYTVNPIAAIAAPFFLGMVADRFFATERVLGVMHLLGGVFLLAAPTFRGDATLFVGMLLLHSLCFMPTLGLANSLAFHNITNQEKQFPLIRVFGTIGWIVAGVLVSGVLHADETATPLYVGGAAALLLGLYSFSLPHTPPPLAGQRTTARQVLGLDALSRLASRPFTIFVISSLLICIPLAAYYAYAPVFVNAAGIESPGFKMTFGQMSETLFMLAMPIFFARLGVKWMLLIGMAAWVARYALFALAAPAGVTWMILVGIALHGICYDFFFVSGQIYVDKKSPPQIRGQAQGFLVLVTYGIGMLIGSLVAGAIFNRVVGTGPDATLTRWQDFWWIPAAFAAAVMVFFGLFFHDRVAEERSGADKARVGRAVAAEPQP